MLTLRCISSKTRALISPIPTSSCHKAAAAAAPFFSSLATAAAAAASPPQPPPPLHSGNELQLHAKGVVALSFKHWFKSRNDPLLDRIFHVLRTTASGSPDAALAQLCLPLSESFVLGVLRHGRSRNDVLSCLKFFDWAGRQPGPFHHTRSTLHAIFKILSRSRLMSLMLDYLDTYSTHSLAHRVRYYGTLVMGYAVAGKPEVALHLFGKMRFQGIDLDSFAYHVLLNALVEESYFDAVEVVADQVKLRGFESEVTHTILVKNFCKKKELEKAEEVIRGWVGEGWGLSGHVVGALVDALCKRDQFTKAGELLDEFSGLGMVCPEHAYGVWIRDLVQAGRVDRALEFVRSERMIEEGYVPDLFRYNGLISRLLRENRLTDVYDLLIEMQEHRISPDGVTMNAALCFFCKAGMVEVALELVNSRGEFGLSPNSMAYNYLVNTLCGDGSSDEAYHVLKDSVEQGYFPGKKTFSILADALCREGKFDKMKELVVIALERNLMPGNYIFDIFISALCKAGRVEDGYLIHGALNRSNKAASGSTYVNLIYGFKKSSRGDIAARLLIEMQEKGHSPTRELYRSVIHCVCEMENPEKQFLKLLEMQLSCHEPSCQVYSFFIDGAGHARKPEFARQVYEMMVRSGTEPNLDCDILMLQSYLKSGKISDALTFYRDLPQIRRNRKKLCNTIIVGLCKAKKPDLALEMFREIRENKLKPSLECYEQLVKAQCSDNRYGEVVNLLDDLIKVGHPVSSFIGNELLLHLLKSQDLYWNWVRTRDVQNETSPSWLLSRLICAFSSHKMDQDGKVLEELVEQCFPLNIYTYNLLLRRLSMVHMDRAIELFNRLCQKGYKPDQWTYDILAHGFLMHGRPEEAKRWVLEMFRKGLEPTERIKQLMYQNYVPINRDKRLNSY